MRLPVIGLLKSHYIIKPKCQSWSPSRLFSLDLVISHRSTFQQQWVWHLLTSPMFTVTLGAFIPLAKMRTLWSKKDPHIICVYSKWYMCTYFPWGKLSAEVPLPPPCQNQAHFPADCHTFMRHGQRICSSSGLQLWCHLEAIICFLAQVKIVLFHIILHIQENLPQ